MAELAKRVYSLEVSGYDDSIRKFQALTAAFQAADDAKRKLNDSLRTATSAGDSTEVAKLTQQVTTLTKQQGELQKQLASTRKEYEALVAAAGKTTGPAPAATAPTTSPTAPIPIPTVEVNQYAASLAQVSQRLVENRIATQANQQATSALLRTISQAGSATGDQIATLTTLRQEQAQLRVSTQELGVQERNLIKDLQNQDGAIVKLSAQLNLLRSTYDRLSETERNSTAGQAQLSQIQQLDTALKTLDAQQGRFQRNVGDYKQQYNGLNVAIQQVLRETPSAAVSLNTFFLAISNNLPQLFDELQKTSAASKAATAASQAAATAAKTETFNRILATGATEAQATAEALLAEKAALANAAQGQAPSLLKQVASSLFSVNTVLTLAVLGLTLFGGQVFAAVSALIKGKSAVDDFKAELAGLNELQKQAAQDAAGQITSLRALYDSATNVNIPLAERLRYVRELKREFPDYFGQISNEAILNGQAEASYKSLTQSILDSARARAAKSQIDKLAAQQLENDFQIQKINTATFNESQRARDFQQTIGGSGTGTGGTTFTVTAEDQRRDIENRRRNAVADIQDKNAALQRQIDFFTRYVGGEQAIAKGIADAHQKQQVEAKDHADKLSAADQNAFKEIDRLRALALANREREILELRQANAAGFADEEAYLRDVATINQNAVDSKRAYLAAKTALNREEALTDAELGKERVDIALKTQQQIEKIRKDEADRLKAISQEEFNDTQNALQSRRDAAANNPDSTQVQRLQAEQEYLTGLQALTVLYNNEQLAIESRFSQDSTKENQKRADAVLEIGAKLRRNEYDLTKARLEEQFDLIKAQGSRELAELRRQTIAKTLAILDDPTTTNAQKKQRLADLERAQTLKQFDVELQDLYRQQTRKGIALKEYEELQAKIEENRLKRAQYVGEKEKTYIERTADDIKGAINNITGFFRGAKRTAEENGRELSRALEAAVNITKQTIAEAYQAYFQQQAQRIDSERETTKETLDRQQEIALGTAQSEAEKDSIRRQFAAKAKEADKKAAEERRALALKQVKIDTALAVAKTLAAYVFPFSLIPAGAALAAGLAQYAIVSQQKFAKGGYTGPGQQRDETGHRVAGVVHQNEWVAPEWMNQHPRYSRVIAGLENVRRRGYADGGFVLPGDGLNAPVNPGSYLLPNGGGAVAVEDAIAGLAAYTQQMGRDINSRIDRIEVVNDPRKTVGVADKYAVANQVGVL